MINYYNLSELPEDDNCLDSVKCDDEEEVEIKEVQNKYGIIAESNIFSVCNIDNDAYINLLLYLNYPATENEPINEITSEGYIAYTFVHFQPYFRLVKRIF